MPTEGDKALDAFRKTHPSREPRIPCSASQLIPLAEHDGVRRISPAPAVDADHGHPPKSRIRPGKNTHLWVIDNTGLPYLLETPLASLDGDKPKHTNLAGEAHVAGELWFVDESTVIVSGGSGRFPPRSPDELDSAVAVFGAFMYSTDSLGWDHETGAPNRLWAPSSEK